MRKIRALADGLSAKYLSTSMVSADNGSAAASAWTSKTLWLLSLSMTVKLTPGTPPGRRRATPLRRPITEGALPFLVALAAGSAVAAGAVILLKQVRFRASERSAAVSGQPVSA